MSAIVASAERLGRSIDETGWFGFGAFVRSLESLELPHMRVSQYLMWDDSRHDPPAQTTVAAHGFTMPEPVARLAALINLPRLPQESWSAVYQVLSDYANSHRFNLTEGTRWSRDRLAEQSLDVSRRADAAGIVLTPEEAEAVRVWLGAPRPAVVS